MNDARFKSFFRDPRSRKIPKNVSKIKIDKRFQSMFKKKQFKDTGGIDGRGRKLDLSTLENLKKLYNVADSSEGDNSESDSKETHPKLTDGKAEDKLDIKEASPEVAKKRKSKKSVRKTDDQENENLHVKDESCYLTNESASKSKQEKQTEKLASSPSKKCKKKKKETFKTQKSTFSDEESDSSKDTDNVVQKKKLKDKNKNFQMNANEETNDYSRAGKSSEKLSVDDVADVEESDNEDSDNSESSSEESDSDEGINEEEGSTDTDSDDSDSSEEDNTEFDHNWEELQKDAPDTDEITKRIAVCNMDWDRIRAEDLYTVFNSFKPANGAVHSVKIYPSEYGLKRMEEENLKGPAELVEETLDPEEVEDEESKASKFHREKLRQYQINRLKYYYAVVECDTPETANTLYEQLNGMEYESSAIRFDLRFIPDDLTFDEKPTSVADSAPDPKGYKPRMFVTTALQQVQVNLTWDETDPKRQETIQRAFTDPETIEKDIKDYLASSSGESDENDDEEVDEKGMKTSTKERIAKFKALLESIEAKEKENDEKIDMEVTWEPGLKEKTENIVKQKIETTENPFEEMLRKKKEDRKQKKKNKTKENNEADELFSASDDDSDSSTGENSKNEQKKLEMDELYLLTDSKKTIETSAEQKSKKKKKQKKNEKSDFKCDVLDPRFSAIYTSHEYNIDPSNPHFKETEGTLAIIKERQKRLQDNDTDETIAKNKHKKKKY